MHKLFKKWWFWVAWAIVDAVVIGAAWIYPIKLSVFLVIQIAIVMYVNQRKKDSFWLMVGAVIGPAGEILAINGGAWKYAAPFILGIPLWLPALWGLAALLGRRVVEEMK
jgi:hypothetical protein